MIYRHHGQRVRPPVDALQRPLQLNVGGCEQEYFVIEFSWKIDSFSAK